MRERLAAVLTPSPRRIVLSTCHRVELYEVVAGDPDRRDARHAIADADREAATAYRGADALAHLFTVAAGLDSAVAGEPQILSQVRRAYLSQRGLHPLLVAALERAIHVGRTVRAAAGLQATRSVGSLAVDAVVDQLASPRDGTVLVIGAGEMGKLAVRALGKRVARVVIANRDVERATALADAHGAAAIPLDTVPAALAQADAVISAADTRGTVLTAAILARRLAFPRPFAIVDVAVPRSLDADARTLLGDRYRSVDDLRGASAGVPEATLRAARERCFAEARRFVSERAPEGKEAIQALRTRAERVRAEKLARALQRLGHLSARDRRVIEALSTTLTNALLHEPTVALREQRVAPDAARALFERSDR